MQQITRKNIQGGSLGYERKLYEVGSTIQASCHCPQLNMRPFKKVVAIWQKDGKLGLQNLSH